MRPHSATAAAKANARAQEEQERRVGVLGVYLGRLCGCAMTYSIIATCTHPLTPQRPQKPRQPRTQAGADLDSLLHLSTSSTNPGNASSASTTVLRVKDTEAVMRAVAAFADHPQVLQVS